MKMRKTLGFFAMALTALTGAFTHGATADYAGDIWSIELSQVNSEAAKETRTSPLKVGESFTIKVRLVNSNWGDLMVDSTGTVQAKPWTFKYVGPEGGEAFATTRMPHLGLWVGGRLKFAELVGYPTIAKNEGADAKDYFTDLVFKYTVDAGDLALPVYLANPDGSGPIMNDQSVSGQYYLEYGRGEAFNESWVLDNGTRKCQFYFSSLLDQNGARQAMQPPQPVTKKDFSTPGVYIQAIDLDDNYADEENGIWRQISAGMTTSTPIDPALSIPDGASETIDLYVWTKDPTKADVVIGGDVTRVDDFTDKDGVHHAVGTIHIVARSTAPSFKIQGKDGMAGQTTEVYLSPTPTNIWTLAAGSDFPPETMISNFVSRTVKIVNPPPPYVAVTYAQGASSVVTADGDYAKHKTVLNVSLSQTFPESDVVVTLTPAWVTPDDTANVLDYFGLSSMDEIANPGAYSEKKLTVTIPAGSKTADIPNLYLYALGADYRTSAITNGIVFSASIEGADQQAARDFFNGEYIPATLHINVDDPSVSMPDAPYAEIQGGESFTFKVKVGDNFQALQSTYDVFLAESGSEYKSVLTNATPNAAGIITLSHAYMTTGTDVNSKIYVVSHDGRTSNPCAFTISKVAAPRRIWGTFVGNDTGVFAEGETAKVKVQLDPAFNLAQRAYVFIVPQNEDGTNYVGSAYFKQQGVLIKNGDTEAAVKPTLEILDGCKKSEAGLNYSFVIRSEDSLETGHVIEGYGSDTFTIIATNVTPNVASAKMGIWEVGEGETCEGTASVGITKRFSITPTENEVDADLYAGWGDIGDGVMGVTDQSEAFLAVWTFFDGAGYSTNVYGSPYQSVPYSFVNAGKIKVTVQLQDKDLRVKGETKYGPKFTFYVNVIDTPAVELSPEGGSTSFYEGANDAKINIRLTEAASVPIDVKLVVSRVGASNDNYPLPAIQGATATENPNEYTVRFEKGKMEKAISLKQLDGTDSTSSDGDGISIKATVVTTTENADGKPYNEVYLEGSEIFYIENEAPMVTAPDSTDTNIYATTLASQQIIKWRVKDPSKIDMTNTYHGAGWQGGLKVTISNSDGAEAVFWTTTGEGVYTNQFSSSGGGKWVGFQVEDKDGRSSEVVKKFYEIAASKGVYIYPQRPFRGGGQSELANAYISADGIGYGRVWAETDALPAISNFRHLWTFAEGSSSAILGAKGYRVGDVDDGTLRFGVGVTSDGAYLKPNSGLTPYAYASEYDSFFYAWIVDEKGESSTLAGTATISPQQGFNAAEKIFGLPEDEDDAQSYVDTVVEAIFSREWRKADNLGDINQDGVPDLFATKTYNGGKLYTLVGQSGGGIEGGESGGGQGGAAAIDVSDLQSVWSLNTDGDKLPLAFNYPDPLNPTKPGWGPGQDFKAGWEIRGFHEGLNYEGVSDPDFSEAETMALFCDYIKAGNENKDTYEELLAAATNWAKRVSWNLERRTDPTKADTDEDGYDDGWEYFFWYYAKAGTIVDGQWRRMTGSRFNLKTPGVGDPIPSEQIAEAFDPLRKHPEVQDASLGWDVKDFDGDGLTDLEEYVLGTNPVHWDSDGDGASDFFEVMNGTNPLDASDGNGANANPDGDFMAYMTSEDTWTVVKVWDATNECVKVYAYPTENGGIALAPGMTTEMVPQVDPDTGVPILDEETMEPVEEEQEVADEVEVWPVTVIEGAKEVPYYLAEEPVLIVDKTGRAYLAKPVPAYKQIKIGENDAAEYYLGEELVIASGAEIKDVAETAEPVARAVTSGFMGGLTLFRYGDGDDAVWVPTVVDGQTMEQFLDEEGTPVERVFPVLSYEEKVNLAYIHHQVYQIAGFDPRTGWFDDGFGYVAARWHTKDSEKAGGEGETGKAVNTRPYTTRDEFLLLAYRFNVTTCTNKAGKVIEARAHRDAKEDVAGVEANVETLSEYFLRAATKATPSNYKNDSDGTGTSSNVVETVTSDVHGADSDADGVPDGWELYVNLDPTDLNPPHSDGAWIDDPLADSDGLLAVEEFAGTDSCNAYKDVESVYTNHPGLVKGWYNKFFPTDPMDADTDGDGLNDKEEGSSWGNAAFYVGRNCYSPCEFTFIYGSNTTYEADQTTTCFRGGGLNPCTVDTDGDLLPDPWEYEFAGLVADENGKAGTLSEADIALLRRSDGFAEDQKANGSYIVGGMDGTMASDAYGFFQDSVTGTRRNSDWDHDGLQNYQEYLVQALRHLRYDDSETPLMGRYLVWQIDMMSGEPLGIAPKVPFMGFTPMQSWDGESFYKTCLNAGYKGNNTTFDFGKMGYFARPPKAWDRLAQNTSGANRCKNYAEAGYRVMLRPQGLANKSGPDNQDLESGNPGSAVRVVAAGYATTDPRRWDSDDDGMDDYYEIFHGLNPLLGSCMDPRAGSLTTSTQGGASTGVISNQKYDRIAVIYKGAITSWNNAWTFWDAQRTKAPEFDAIKYPWMMGTAECDADGDGLRNSEEALTANLTSPTTTHTDPTPLWFTDSTSTNLASYVAQYYQFDPTYGAEADLAYCWDRGSIIIEGAQDGWDCRWMFAFEENEGYDTDHDFLKDSDELVKRVTPASDPLDFSDPDRRQAMWFPGVESAVVSTLGTQQRPNALEYDLLRQFTVEAWIRPEVVGGRDQVILERVSNYGGSTLSNAADVVRANFRLGINADGNVYGEFEGSTVDSGNARVTGSIVAADAWTHVAMTFDGSQLRLYVNGDPAPVASASSVGLIPANGVTIMLEESRGESFPVVKSGYATVPSAIILGASAVSGDAITLSAKTTWANYDQMYQGYLDEVRVWDGARKGTEIAESYKTRYTQAQVKDLRQSVYRAWSQGLRRNNTLNAGTLPCELLQHYNFMALPGELDSLDVLTEPMGFRRNVLDNVRVNGSLVDLRCGWWASVPVHSTVYDNYTIVPWIPNTVAHLPLLDGSVWDSFYWNENVAGVSPAVESGVNSFTFKNTSNPYPYWRYFKERVYHTENWAALASSSNSSFEAFATLNTFDLRSGFVGTSDLVPLGGAFPKRVEEMWDGAGAADAWLASKYDYDQDGLPDWWEEMYGDPDAISWDTLVTGDDGRAYAAWERYLRDLAKGLLVDGSFDETFGASDKDVDQDGLPDWWEDLVGIQGTGGEVGDALADNDNDQLCNWVEYLIGEGFTKVSDDFVKLDPTAMRTDMVNGQLVPDYFLPVGRLYLGEMFTDHDFIEDWWERSFASTYASQFVFDAQKDADDDGWSNFAEARWSQWSALLTADVISRWIDGGTLLEKPVACRPEPALGVKVAYQGRQSVAGKAIVVRATTDNPNVEDAVFKIASAQDGGVALVKYIGGYRKDAVVRGHLHPGSIVPGDGVFKWVQLTSDKSYTWSYAWYGEYANLSYNSGRTGFGIGTLEEFLAEQTKYPHIELLDATIAWDQFAQTKSDSDGHFGTIVFAGSVSNATASASGEISDSIGKIDYRTGDYELDMAKLAAISGKSEAELSAMVMMCEYGYRTSGEFPQTFYLSQPDSGYVREGRNYITAFIDLNDDGVWTPGEPFGAATPYGTDVGWWKTEVSIEMTDTAPQTYRVDLKDAVAATDFEGMNPITDRGVNGYRLAENRPIGNVGTNMPAVTETDVRVRLALTEVNGRGGYQQSANASVVYPALVAWDGTVNLAGNSLFTEANILKDGHLDLGWGDLSTQATRMGLTLTAITQTAFRVVIGNGIVASAFTNNNLAAMIVNKYESGAAGNQTKAVPVSPKGTVYSACPTFTWTHENTIGKSYPAFRLRVWSENGSTLVYDSGNRRAPARDSKGVYSWTAPIYADMVTPQGKIFATTNNYQWSVSMLDAKFTTPNTTETKTKFRMECSGAGGAQSDYGSVDVCVKYFGPANLSAAATTSNGLIRVQAFTSPDFSGQPVAEAFVLASAESLYSTTENSVNCTLKGIPAGTCYVRAFVDSDGNGEKADWETWGYANYVGTEVASVYNPKSSEIVFGRAEKPFVTVYMEDMDTDNDAFPDVYEYDLNKNLDTLGPASGNTFFTKVNPELKTSLKAYTKLGSGATLLEATPFAAMLNLASGSGTDAMLAAASLLGAAPVAARESVFVSIREFSLAEGAKIAISSEVTGADSVLVSMDSEAKVAVYLVASDSLDFANATSAKVKDIVICANTDEIELISAAELAKVIGDNDLGAKAFFKVKLVK